MTSLKERDIAGPGIGSYEELTRILPTGYRPLRQASTTADLFRVTLAPRPVRGPPGTEALFFAHHRGLCVGRALGSIRKL